MLLIAAICGCDNFAYTNKQTNTYFVKFEVQDEPTEMHHLVFTLAH